MSVLFNLAKCHVMHIGHGLAPTYNLKSGTVTKQLAETEEERDLGVYITADLKWETQCQKASSKAMSVLGMVKRSFGCMDYDSFIILYSTYIRPHLEYCVQAWAPYYRKAIDCLEKVQRRATKLVKGLKHVDYE